MRPPLRVPSFVAVAVAAGAVISLGAAGTSGRNAFLDAWEGHPVLLTRTLFSIVFDERSRVLPLFKHQGRISGLTVATPSDSYYLFEARRDSEDDVISRDPNLIVSRLREQYRRSAVLDIGNVQDVESVMLVRYEPGVELFVKKVQIEKDRVRLLLHRDRRSELATTLTVKWPVPLSKDLAEAANLHTVLARFVARQ